MVRRARGVVLFSSLSWGCIAAEHLPNTTASDASDAQASSDEASISEGGSTTGAEGATATTTYAVASEDSDPSAASTASPGFTSSGFGGSGFGGSSFGGSGFSSSGFGSSGGASETSSQVGESGGNASEGNGETGGTLVDSTGLATTTWTSTTRISTGDGGPSGPSARCEDVRLTRYTASERTGCGYMRNHAFMPAFVRERGLTMAMAEPFYGGSFGGDPGESCGECWEITTATGTEVVMSDNLCPIEGNPLCAEAGRLHFDLSMEAAEALQGGRNDFAVARPVPCPVSGSIHIEVRDRSRGYYQFGVLNHRIPVRRVEMQVAGVDAWIEATRVWGGIWAVTNAAFDRETGGAGGRLRLTSAQGQVVTSSVALGGEDEGDTTNLQVQFTDRAPDSGDFCEP